MFIRLGQYALLERAWATKQQKGLPSPTSVRFLQSPLKVIMVFKSSRPEISIPDQDLFTFIFSPNEFNTRFPHTKKIFIDGPTKRTISYAELKSLSKRFGAGLEDKLAFKKGEVAAIFAPNQVDYPVICFGVLAAAGTVTCANPAYTATELKHQLHNSGARLMITVPELLPVAVEAADKAGLPRDQIYLFGGKAVDGFAMYESLYADREIENPKNINTSEDIAYLSYSSGTTGLPKGVMLTHRNIVSNCCQIVDFDSGNILETDVWIGFLPFYHIYGLTNLLHMATYAGVPIVVMPRFDLAAFLENIQEHKVTFAMIVPPIVLALAKHPIVGNYDLSSMRLFSSGAAPLSKELIEAMVKRINVGIRQGYGMTEASPTTHILPFEKWGVYGSIGLLIANIEAKIVDENDKELGINQDGELLVRGPNIMKGYLNNDEATRKTLMPDGFLRTGDVCRVDENGYYYIVDRVKELIKYKGSQVPPAELEALLITHPLVADVAVIGVYSDVDATELPRAYVVLGPGAKPSPELAKEIETWVAGRVAQHKKLRGGVKFVTEIPKSGSGKILRRMLRDQAAREDKEAAKKDGRVLARL